MRPLLQGSLLAGALAAPAYLAYAGYTSAPAETLPTQPSLGEYDVVVVGGGIVGCATAREILRRHKNFRVAILEKEAEVAWHQTGHNSGVIHAGIYYQPGTTMARLCVRGAALVYDYCAKNNIPHERVGKLIVACNEAEVPVLHVLLDRGTKNGVQGLEILTGHQVEQMEPNVKVVAALHSPNTGICDFGALCRSFARDVVATGLGCVQPNFEVQRMVDAGDAVLVVGKEPRQNGPLKSVKAKHVISCCGLYSDSVAQSGGGQRYPKLLPFRGTYYQMKPEFRNICKRNIYPVPSGGGIPVGVHFTPTCNLERGSQMIIGPGACLAFAREGYKFFDINVSELWKTLTHLGLFSFAFKNFDMSVRELYRDLNQKAFLAQAQRIIPSLQLEQTEPSFSGVMAQVLDNYGNAASDFIFEIGALNGKVLHVRNAPSPACTASMAIAEEVVGRAEAAFGWTPDPVREPAPPAPAPKPEAPPKRSSGPAERKKPDPRRPAPAGH